MSKGFGISKNDRHTPLSIEDIVRNEANAIALAIKYRNEGNYTKSIGIIEGLIKRKGGAEELDCILIGILGECLIREGRYHEAIHYLKPCAEAEPDNADLLIKIASSYRHLDLPEESLLILEKLILSYPLSGELHYNYANSLRDANRPIDALESYKRALHLGYDVVDTYTNYLDLLVKTGKNSLAKALIKDNLQKFKDYPNFVGLACQTLIRFQMFKEASKALVYLENNSNERDGAVFLIKSQIYEGQKDIENAIRCINQALEAEPNNIGYRLHYGNLLQSSNKLKEACLEYQNILEADPEQMEAHRRIAVCTKYHENHPHLHEIRRIGKQLDKLDKANAKNILFALAKAEEECSNYDQAMIYLDEANKLMKGMIPAFDLIGWSHNSFDKLEIDRHILRNSLRVREKRKGKGLVFIVGMPRCGSTLTESIISSTPNSLDLGEISAFSEVIEEHFADCSSIQSISEETLDDIGTNYLERLPDGWQTYSIITDKNLYNWRYAGLIASCLPGSKIIHSLRNPVDNMLSIYKAHFPIGNEYACDLDEIFKIYQLHYQVMKIYKARHKNIIFESSYDELVTKPESYIPNLINKLGLEWIDSYLRPEKNNRTVRTASNVQVRSPIHANSVSAWKRYKSKLDPYANKFRELGYMIGN